MNHRTINVVRTIIGVIGNAISLGLFLSPWPTIQRIHRRKTVEEFSPYIYVAGILNCCLWVLYGSPSVHPNSTLVWTINSVGLVLYTVYLGVFVYYAPMNKKLKVFIGIAIVAVVITAISVPILMLVHTTKERSFIVGIICIVFNVGLYASPLTIVKKVFQTKSVEFLPFWVCLAGFANGVVWTAYSLLPFDVNILVGNGIGAALGLFQMGLHWRYGSNKSRNDGDGGQNIVQIGGKASSEVQLGNVV